MKSNVRLALVTWAVLSAFRTVQAQTYPFRMVGPSEGLGSSFVHALTQDRLGYLWIGTGDGLARFDGRRATLLTAENGLAENYVSCLLSTSQALWAGHNSGSVTRIHKEGTTVHRPASEDGSTVTALIDDGAGGVYAGLLNQGIIHLDSNARPLERISLPMLLHTLVQLKGGRFIAGGSGGAWLIDPKEGPLPLDITTSPVTALHHDRTTGWIYAGTEDEGVIIFRMEGSQAAQMETLISYDQLQAPVKALAMDERAHLIVGTFGSGAWEFTLELETRIHSTVRYNNSNGLGSDHISCVFIDREDGLWLSRFGQGLARRLDRAVSLYTLPEALSNEVFALARSGSDMLLGMQGRIVQVDGPTGAITSILDQRQGLPDDAITALCMDGGGRLWAGTRRSGVYQQGTNGQFTAKALGVDHLSRHVQDLLPLGDTVWVATGNGCYIIGPGGIDHLSTLSGLPHNRINGLHVATEGGVWLACNNGGTARVDHEGVLPSGLSMKGETHHVMALCQNADGALWLATAGGGVWRLDEDSTRHLTSANGLRSDFTYALVNDPYGGIWVAHRGGVSHVREGKVVRVFDQHLGLGGDQPVNALLVDERGRLWCATEAGAVLYDPASDAPLRAPPPVDIFSVRAFDRELGTATAQQLSPDIYRITYDFRAVSLRDPEAVTYRYILEGHDLEWSTGNTGQALYRRVEDGEHRFVVQACLGGHCNEAIALPQLTILTPLWKRGWFISTGILTVLLIVWSIFRIRLRNQRRIQDYLQRTLDERTREVHLKKEEIERKNTDITASITYAQRIQQAMLPAEHQLRAQFPDSFIFHQPRDIVSGDFYWFRRFDDLFVLACADCTGHGVPGALMSMIGTLLLRDVSTNKEVTAPDVLLQQLDAEVRTVLQHDHHGTRNNEGMDISVCEIDMGTRRLRASSAMHDLLIWRQGALHRLRGERWSIGGIQRNGHPNTFGLIEQDLQAGDRIYLFSDGVPDQFGGLDGKKLKVSGLMQLIESIAHLPMEQQAQLFRNKFLSWMNGHEQVDDVLFIGIEV